MSILNVKNLSKKYEKFHLDNVSFSLDKGYIMGFIGNNGAGKTTTMKCILNMTHPDSGSVEIFNQEFISHELDIKQNIGLMLGEANYYTKSKIKNITAVAKRFYSNWDDNTYKHYMKKFKLDEDKKISELSRGMSVKYSITLALSHNAKLFFLDEPTSGLDPAARDELLDILQGLVEDGEKSVIFSTHITSDLEKCADYITYIENGKIIKSETKDDFLEMFSLVKGTKKQLDEVKQTLIAYKENSFGFVGLIEAKDIKESNGLTVEPASLDDIMVYHTKRENDNEESII